MEKHIVWKDHWAYTIVMIDRVNFYRTTYRDITQGSAPLEQHASAPPVAPCSKPPDPGKAAPIEDTTALRPFSPEGSMAVSLSGSVIHEPNSLLTYLAGTGRLQETSKEMTGTALAYSGSSHRKGFEILLDEPLTNTSEILV